MLHIINVAQTRLQRRTGVMPSLPCLFNVEQRTSYPSTITTGHLDSQNVFMSSVVVVVVVTVPVDVVASSARPLVPISVAVVGVVILRMVAAPAPFHEGTLWKVAISAPLTLCNNDEAEEQGNDLDWNHV